LERDEEWVGLVAWARGKEARGGVAWVARGLPAPEETAFARNADTFNHTNVGSHAPKASAQNAELL